MSTEEVLTQIDAAIGDWEVGPDAMRCNAPEGTHPGLPRVARVMHVRIVDESTETEGLLERLRQAIDPLAEALVRAMPALLAFARSIRTENPARPAQLPIDGHAYRRRTRNRSTR